MLADAAEWLSAAELATKGVSRAVLKALLERELVAQSEKRVLRNSYARPVAKGASLKLTAEQELAVERLTAAIDRNVAATTKVKLPALRRAAAQLASKKLQLAQLCLP